VNEPLSKTDQKRIRGVGDAEGALRVAVADGEQEPGQRDQMFRVKSRPSFAKDGKI